MKNKNRECILILIFLFTLCSACSQDGKSLDCQVYLEPILGFDFSIGQSKEKLLGYFTECEEVNRETVRHIPKDVIPYRAAKRVKLPNGYQTEVEFYFLFKENELSTYSLKFDIGNNYRYFWELINYIGKHDQRNINAFIYDSDKKRPSYVDRDDENCRRILSVSRGSDDSNIFEITCKVN